MKALSISLEKYPTLENPFRAAHNRLSFKSLNSLWSADLLIVFHSKLLMLVVKSSQISLIKIKVLNPKNSKTRSNHPNPKNNKHPRNRHQQKPKNNKLPKNRPRARRERGKMRRRKKRRRKKKLLSSR